MQFRWPGTELRMEREGSSGSLGLFLSSGGVCDSGAGSSERPLVLKFVGTSPAVRQVLDQYAGRRSWETPLPQLVSRCRRVQGFAILQEVRPKRSKENCIPQFPIRRSAEKKCTGSAPLRFWESRRTSASYPHNPLRERMVGRAGFEPA